MWPFRKRNRPDIDAVARVVHAHAQLLARLREDHDALAAAHERLRGRFYAKKGAEEAVEAPRSKAEVLQAFGFVPGKPPPHRS